MVAFTVGKTINKHRHTIRILIVALAPLLSHLAGVGLRYRTVMKYNSFKNELAYLTIDRHRQPVDNVRVISYDNPTMGVWAAAKNVFLNPNPSSDWGWRETV